MERRKSGLDETLLSLLARREKQGRLRRLTVPAPGIIDFSSNGYLSLSSNSDVKRAYLELLQSSELSFSLGSGGSRLLDGNTEAAEELEQCIASFHRAPTGLLFNSGFEANTGLFSCGPQPGDTIVYDELIHASVHDGMKLSRARKVPFAHNCVERNDVDETAAKFKSLDTVLRHLTEGEQGSDVRSGKKNVFVAVEGVYSMDGDVAALKDIVECVEKRLPLGNGYIIVDEAHSTGIFGELGRGLVCQLGLEDRVWARVHTFGKAMGCSGAIILCSPTTRRYIFNYARSFIYTTAMGFPALASIRTAYRFLAEGHAEPLLCNLQSLIRNTHRLLIDVVTRQRPHHSLLRINFEPPESPVIPLFSMKARSLATYCQGKGFMLRPIVAPTVPHGTDRVRLCLHAGNTLAEVYGLCKVLEEWVCEQRGVANARPPVSAPTISAEASSIVYKSRL
ncbi:8-amino-7-oxononanoate synthase [Cladobotryum mycophilum]|uniref:8-amino-7-oxononanoate synthase n=1 Tax=Cladobotryum mycophilum TaxID=491253 RepID=A0ABR0SB58_9HYPO